MAEASDKDKEIHHLIISGDDLAFARFCDVYYDQVFKKVAGFNKGIYREDETLVADVVTDVFLKYFRDPQRYDPSKQSLERFLIMDAEGDLKNEWEKRKRRAKKVTNSVELEKENRNSLLSDELQDPHVQLINKEALKILDQKLDQVFHLEADIVMAHLMLAGERRSTEYAKVLGIENLSPEEQRKEVKKQKDRIDKVLQRKLKGK
jgi:DNA-directed RNA polymerase specialized sigma24 family protein